MMKRRLLSALLVGVITLTSLNLPIAVYGNEGDVLSLHENNDVLLSEDLSEDLSYGGSEDLFAEESEALPVVSTEIDGLKRDFLLERSETEAIPEEVLETGTYDFGADLLGAASEYVEDVHLKWSEDNKRVIASFMAKDESKAYYFVIYKTGKTRSEDFIGTYPLRVKEVGLVEQDISSFIGAMGTGSYYIKIKIFDKTKDDESYTREYEDIIDPETGVMSTQSETIIYTAPEVFCTDLMTGYQWDYDKQRLTWGFTFGDSDPKEYFSEIRVSCIDLNGNSYDMYVGEDMRSASFGDNEWDKPGMDLTKEQVAFSVDATTADITRYRSFWGKPVNLTDKVTPILTGNRIRVIMPDLAGVEKTISMPSDKEKYQYLMTIHIIRKDEGSDQKLFSVPIPANGGYDPLDYIAIQAIMLANLSSSGTYYLSVDVECSDPAIAGTYKSNEYKYTAPDKKLDKPANLRRETVSGKTRFLWDYVMDAAEYKVALYKTKSSKYLQYVSKNYFELSEAIVNDLLKEYGSGRYTVEISALSDDIENATESDPASIEIIIGKEVKAASVTLSKTSASVYSDDTTGILVQASVLPSTASEKSVKWAFEGNGSDILRYEQDDTDPCSITLYPVSSEKYGTVKLTATTVDGSNKSASCTITVKPRITGISISSASEDGEDHISLPVNKTAEMVASLETVSGQRAYDTTVRWITSDASVVSVDVAGKIKGKNPGKAYVYAVSAEDETKVSEQCEVEVYEPVTNLSFEKKAITIETGKTAELAYTVAPAALDPEADNRFSISSENTDYLTITKKTGSYLCIQAADEIPEGSKSVTATITAASSDGKKKAVCTVTILAPVKEYVPLKKISVAASRLTLHEGKSVKPEVTITPFNATYEYNSTVAEKGLTYTAVDEASSALVTIDNAAGIITAKELPGAVSKATAKVRVTARSDGGVEKTADITITIVKDEVRVNKIKLDKNKISMGIGAVAVIGTEVSPAWADDTDLIWTDDKSGIVEYEKDEKGNLHIIAKEQGKVTLTATSSDGSKKSAKCTITVGVPAVNVKISNAPERLAVGKKVTPKISVSGEGGIKCANTAVKWVSSDESIANVDSRGTITAKATGTVTISAFAEEMKDEGSTAFDSCIISVYVPVNKISLTRNRLTINEGSTGKLGISVYGPLNATDTKVNWSVDGKGASVISLDKLQTDCAGGEDGNMLVITAIAPGTAKITGITNDGSNKKVTATVTVLGKMKDDDVKINIKNLPKKAEMDSSTNNSKSVVVTGLPVKQKVTLTSVLTKTAADKTVTFTSSDKDVVTVDGKGNVTARQPGTAVVTMTTADGGFKAVCTITVVQ